MKLSIIIPYYNTLELTRRLLNNIKPQMTEETEVIVVDDGCFEDSLEYYDIYKYDGWLKLIQQENGGVSKARNVGIKEAKGKYVAFIDSDDMVTMDYVEQLLKAIDNVKDDVIVFNWLDITNNIIVRNPKNPSVWKAIYKKDIIPMFDETLRVREDYFFNQELDKKNPSKYYLDRVLYMYNSGREGSLWWNETHK